jgi:septal ring factor EnvC (AmiA/AmiB activator)
MMRAFALALMCLPIAADADEQASSRAEAAVILLDEARDLMAEAGAAQDPVPALTGAIAQFETGLTALERAIPGLAAQRASLSDALTAGKSETAALLVALQHLGSMDAPLLLLHPGGATGAVRAGILLSGATQALAERAEDVREDVDALADLGERLAVAEARLAEGTQALGRANAALDDAIARRAALPRRFAVDPVREAILLSSAETLDAFVTDLDRMSAEPLPPAPPLPELRKGDLPLPVRMLSRAPAEASGLVLTTRAQALVTSPAAGTLRHSGPLLDLGEVVILEPRAGVLVILAGLSQTHAITGEIVAAGDPLGRMGGSLQAIRDKFGSGLSTDGDETGAGGTDALYIQVRENNSPVDPTTWFRMQEDG